MQSTRTFHPILLACLLFLAITSLFPASGPRSLPVTGEALQIEANPQTGIAQNLGEFIQSVKNGDANTLTGIYIPEVFAVPVVQQPNNEPNFVSTDPDTVTQFKPAASFGTKGLLAHNYLTGKEFSRLEMDQVLYLIYGDGSTRAYSVSAIERFQALTPESPYSNFIDERNPGVSLTAGQVFNSIYTSGDQVVLQTCIEKNGDWSWGRLFIIARPYAELAQVFPTNHIYRYADELVSR